MTDWAGLRDAYGPAADIPALLASAEAQDADDGEAWNDLYGRLFHQGTVYSASYAAIPALAAMTSRHQPAGNMAPLHLAAAIIASTDGPEDSATVRRRYEDDLLVLRAAAERNLRFARDDADFVYGLEALMAFEDGGDLDDHGEGNGPDPSCMIKRRRAGPVASPQGRGEGVRRRPHRAPPSAATSVAGVGALWCRYKNGRVDSSEVFRADATHAGVVARLLFDFNTEFGTPGRGPSCSRRGSPGCSNETTWSSC
jgi:hypothetical protein